MLYFELISVAVGMMIFITSLWMFRRIRQQASVHGTRHWWGFLGLLIAFFLVGYAVFFAILLTGETPDFDVNLMISQIFLGGSIFVVTCAWIFLSTIREKAEVDKKLGEAMSQLRHAQKLEAVGRLAGNVAHDFNNLLTAIIGNADMGLRSADASKPQVDYFQQICEAAVRAEKLTSQLLTFSRRQPTHVEPLCLQQLITAIESLLRQSVRPNVVFTVKIDDPGYVEGDADQLKLLILNLVSNANDAIQESGEVVLQLRMIDARATDTLIAAAEDEPDDDQLVELSVSDNGRGIEEPIRHQIFDPYFTTKENDKGTGLGLSIAYGIARQHKGTLSVASQPGEGSCFKLRLPTSTERPTAPRNRAAPTNVPDSPNRGLTILVIDDDPQVLKLTEQVLRSAHFDVTATRSAIQALAFIENDGKKFDLVLSDVLMPEMTGPEIIARITQRHPDQLVVFMTGFPGDNTQLISDTLSKHKLIMKPFTSESLLKEIYALI